MTADQPEAEIPLIGKLSRGQEPDATATVVATVDLVPQQFLRTPRTLLDAGDFHVECGRYPSGIEMLTVSNSVGRVVVLPFVGQQVWDAHFHGRTLTMRSIFDEPVPTADYLANYGAYLIHCGGSAMGNPGPDDTHPLHGELPNLRLDTARLQLVRDVSNGALSLTLFGSGTSRVAFGAVLDVDIALTLGEGSGVMDSAVRVTNRSQVPQPLMYLAHVNFRPAVDGHIDEQLRPQAVAETRDDVTVEVCAANGGVEAQTVTADEFDSGTYPLDRLLAADIRVLPELVQLVPLRIDDHWARSRQVHGDGTADVVAQDTTTLPYTVRWLCRSGDYDAFGFALPATAGAEGRAVESALGRVADYPSGGELLVHFRHGVLAPDESEPAARPSPFREIQRHHTARREPRG